MTRKFIHHILYYAVTLVLACSCATKRKGDSSPSAPPPDIKNLGNIPSRTLIDSSSLKVPTLNMITQPVCKQDNALVVNVTNPDSNADYFLYKLCPKGGKASDCTLGEFLDYSPLIHPADGGDYTISVRTCVDPNHSLDPKMLCGAWSSEQPYTFNTPSASTVKLLEKQADLLNKTTAVCQKIRDAMAAYVATADQSDPLYPSIKQSLEYIGINGCREILLSEHINLADEVAAIKPPTTNSDSSSTATQTQTQTQTQQVPTIIYQTTQAPPQLVTGTVFLILGAAGFIGGGVMGFREFQKTVSEETFKLGKELLDLQKSVKDLQIANYDVEINEIYNVGHLLATGGGKDLPTLEAHDAKIDAALDKSLKDWGFPTGLEVLTADEKAAIDAYKANPKDKAAGAKLVAANERLHQTFGTFDRRNFSWAAAVDQIPIFGDDFKKLIRERDTLVKAHASKAAFDAQVARLPAGGRPPVVDTAWLEKEFKDRMAARDQIQADWNKQIEEYKKSASDAFKRGAMQGGLAGAGLGGIVGHFMSPIGFGGLQGALAGGAGAGLLNGGYQALEAMYENYKLGEPKFTEKELQKFKNSTPAEREKLIKDYQARKTNKEVKLKESETSRASYQRKLGAAAPWLVGAGLSGIAMIIGGVEVSRGLRLADLSPAEQFMKNYIPLYKQGQKFNKDYNAGFSKLLSGSCN